MLMFKTKRKVLQGLYLTLSFILLLGSAYIYQRSKFIQKANSLFDPKQHAFSGIYLPWPIGSPTLCGRFDTNTDDRIRSSLGYDSGSISTNGMTLIIMASDGTYIVQPSKL